MFCACGSKLHVLKTIERQVSTLEIGEFYAHETILHCKRCRCIYPSDDLGKLVPEGCSFGFNVMEYVGRAAFLHFQTDEEIIEQLRPKKIFISPSEIAYLEKRFIVYLALAHGQSSQRIREAIEGRGGYMSRTWRMKNSSRSSWTGKRVWQSYSRKLMPKPCGRNYENLKTTPRECLRRSDGRSRRQICRRLSRNCSPGRPHPAKIQPNFVVIESNP